MFSCRYVSLALCALVGSQCGTHFRQFVPRRFVMFGMYVLLWANCCLLFWPWHAPQSRLSLEPLLFVLGSAALLLFAPICFFFPATIRSMWVPCNALFFPNHFSLLFLPLSHSLPADFTRSKHSFHAPRLKMFRKTTARPSIAKQGCFTGPNDTKQDCFKGYNA